MGPTVALDGVDDVGRNIGVGGRTAFVVAAGRLLPLGRDRFEPEVVEEDVIDVIARVVVPPDREHDGVLLAGPGDEHPVIAIEVSGADVVEHGAGKPVARRDATAVAQITERRYRCLLAAASEIANLALAVLVSSTWIASSPAMLPRSRPGSRRSRRPLAQQLAAAA